MSQIDYLPLDQHALSHTLSFLALDASTEQCSVALIHDGKITQRMCRTPRTHAQVLLPFVDELLTHAGIRLADLQGIAVGRGPGSFTGIRISMGVAQGLAFGASLPVVGIDSLHVLASSITQASLPAFPSEGYCLCALDARMAEVYWAIYRVSGERLECVAAPAVSSPAVFMARVNALKAESQGKPLVGLGHGWTVDGVDSSTVDAVLATEEGEPVLPTAYGLLRVLQQWDDETIRANGTSAEQVEPLYLRNDVAWEKRKRIREQSPFNET